MINSPLPIFDSMENLDKPELCSYLNDSYNKQDIQQALAFLKFYKGSQGTFNSYRREIERLIHWCALVANKSLKELKRNDIEDFVRFCQKPPKEWVGTQKPSRFIVKDGLRVPNPDWRPFVVTVSKTDTSKNKKPSIKNFELYQGALKELFAILSSFYNYDLSTLLRTQVY